jgi:DNA-binding IclR family transcriptional regulator
MKTQHIDKRVNLCKVQSLERALGILECFSYQKKELCLTDLSHLTSLNKTTVKRLVSNLTHQGFLRQNAELKRYPLGLRMFELGGIVFSSFSLGKAAMHPMSQLQNTIECTSAQLREKVTKHFGFC